MNEHGTFDYGRLKALFAKLVIRAGRQDAAAAYLGISRQRVSQLGSANPEHARDIPTWEQVWTLEDACGQSVVFGALALSIEPPTVSPAACPLKETHDVVQASAALLPIAAALQAGDFEAFDALMEGVDRLKNEARELRTVATNVTRLREVR
ncbi:DNA-binding transcriptional regulator YdaS (Cro superfamily) [Brevundimonas bullata]|uniref:DNA-binding transcriptional regulator YdaS (Cro superfamily) n=1 Tax=Brevundimonas bullata TaxID=13160 RepID=A0A7W7N333_9CAUL|nr:hypothetical protein [Brevundimonas bullata]MBB4797988.1 DNA-binding transcriptional regulator YdaS (Cro superfamily) [Brevundimonas bullata]MBB6382947.1 DNA-binding transcriptional regulator YdaS (Cro superfamily) [Brevundimonas bullata]